MAAHVNGAKTELVARGSSTSSNKRVIVEDADILSTMPLEIRMRILSFLPASDAARVGLLSRVWRTTWRSQSVLVFDYCRFPGMEKNIPGFAKFISETLDRHDDSAVETLEFYFCRFADYFIPIMTKWIEFGANHVVKNLVLYGNRVDDEIRFFSHSLFPCERLVRLELSVRNLVVSLPETVVLPNLQKLKLRFSVLPVSFWNRLSSLPSLKKLSIFFSDFMPLEVITVSSLKLKEFTVFVCLGMEKCWVMNFPCLEKFIYITYALEGEENDMEVFNNAFQWVINGRYSHVITNPGGEFSRAITKVTKEIFLKDYLLLSQWLIEYISMIRDLPKQLSSYDPFLHTSMLEISMWPNMEHIRVIMQLMAHCPNLCTLSLTIEERLCKVSDGVPNAEDPLEFCDCNRKCSSVTHASIRNFGGDEVEMLLAKCLLSNLPKLKWLRIFTNLFMAQNDMEGKIMEILEYDRASSVANVKFIQGRY